MDTSYENNSTLFCALVGICVSQTVCQINHVNISEQKDILI